MERNYELDEESLLDVINKDNRRIDIIYLMQKYEENRTDFLEKSLKDISKRSYKILNNVINDYLTKVVDAGLKDLLTVDLIQFVKRLRVEDQKNYRESDEYKFYLEYISPVTHRISDLDISFVARTLCSDKRSDNSGQFEILNQSLNLGFKYINDLSIKYKLDAKTVNYFSRHLFLDICNLVDATFNPIKFIESNKEINKSVEELQKLHNELYKNKDYIDISEGIRQEIDILENDLNSLSRKIYSAIPGYDEVDTIYSNSSIDTKLNFEELKRMIKSRFNTSNNNANKEQLKYVLWIMQLTANSKTDILPFQDKFILDNMIVPWSQELRELLGEDFDNTNFNIEEAIKYINRLRTDGEYKSLYYKTVALKRIFEVSDKPKNLNITEYKYRDTLTTDYSDRMNCILKVLKKNGTKAEPALEEKNGFIVYKNGNALDDSDIELFWYLIGELEEHGCEQEIVFRKSDIVNNMGYKSLRGNKLDNLTSSLMNLNAQSIAIIDSRDDKVGKRLDKVNFKKFKGTQLLRADIIGEGDEVLIKFTSPFSKYFRQQKQFGRLLNREMINKYLYSNTRVLKISRELSRMLFINSQKNKKQISSIEINYDTLIKNIGEWDKYTSHSNQRVYLSRLTKDIEKAISYIDKGFNHEIIKTTPRNISNGKIRLLKNS